MDLEKELAVAKEAAVQAGYAIMDVYPSSAFARHYLRNLV